MSNPNQIAGADLPLVSNGPFDTFIGVDEATKALRRFPAPIVDGMKGYATKSALDTDTSQTPGTLALVTNDPTPANNGTYRWSGSTWLLSADRVTGLESLTAGLDAKDALQRAVWQLPWLDPAMLTRFGGGSGDFDRPSEPHRLMVAKAIKDIQLDGADPAKQYRIITFSYGHVTSQDLIIVAATDGTAFATSGNVTFTKNPNGPTEVSFASGSNRVTAWIDYREITQTGILVNVTDSPLRIAKTSGHDLLRRRVDSAETLLEATTAVAASASASAAAEYGVFVVGLIPDGAYPAAMRAKVSGSIAEFHAAILDGAGTASVDVMVAGTVVASFTVTGDVTSPLATSIPEGGSVIFLISGASGITGLWVQITGEAA